MWFRFVQDYALERIKFALPGRGIQGLPGRLVARLPTHVDPRLTEIDVLGVVLIVEPRCKQTDDVHLRHAAVACELSDLMLLRISSGNLRVNAVMM
jgi:hypothetical protein